MMLWYTRRRPSISTEDILTLGGPLVWFRWLKKPMKPLAWWRSPKDVLGPTVGDSMTLQPLSGSWSSCMMMMTSYGPWHAMEPMNISLVWWRSPWILGTPDEYLDALVKVVKPMWLDGMMKAPTHMWQHLVTCLHALWWGAWSYMLWWRVPWWRCGGHTCMENMAWSWGQVHTLG